MQLYRQLALHLRVDVFGRAAGQPLCASCLLRAVAGYRFYLSFENSEHRDYITEKFWRNALLAGAVPVVLGPPRAAYEAVAPPDAFLIWFRGKGRCPLQCGEQTARGSVALVNGISSSQSPNRV